MKSLSFKFRQEKSLIMVLASSEQKAVLTVLITDDLVKKGLDASSFVKEIAKEIDGGGGGQKFLLPQEELK